MNNSALPYWLALMIAFVGLYGAWKWYQVEQSRWAGGVVVNDQPPLEEFELDECRGGQMRSSDLRGKVWVVTFFFSTCDGSCPRLNSSIKYLNTLEEIKDVKWVSISVDPDVDTLPVLEAYAKRYGADPERWLFCRGDLSYVNRIGKDFLKVDDVSLRGHRDFATIIDRRGTVRGVFDATSRSQSIKMVELLTELLAEPIPEEIASQQAPPEEDGPAESDSSQVDPPPLSEAA